MSSKFHIQLCREDSLDHTCARVHVSKKVQIPPKSEMFIKGKLEGKLTRLVFQNPSRIRKKDMMSSYQSRLSKYLIHPWYSQS